MLSVILDSPHDDQLESFPDEEVLFAKFYCELPAKRDSTLSDGKNVISPASPKIPVKKNYKLYDEENHQD